MRSSARPCLMPTTSTLPDVDGRTVTAPATLCSETRLPAARAFSQRKSPRCWAPVAPDAVTSASMEITRVLMAGSPGSGSFDLDVAAEGLGGDAGAGAADGEGETLGVGRA